MKPSHNNFITHLSLRSGRRSLPASLCGVWARTSAGQNGYLIGCLSDRGAEMEAHLQCHSTTDLAAEHRMSWPPPTTGIRLLRQKPKTCPRYKRAFFISDMEPLGSFKLCIFLILAARLRHIYTCTKHGKQHAWLCICFMVVDAGFC